MVDPAPRNMKGALIEIGALVNHKGVEGNKVSMVQVDRARPQISTLINNANIFI
jgi:hypothetical protein